MTMHVKSFIAGVAAALAVYVTGAVVARALPQQPSEDRAWLQETAWNAVPAFVGQQLVNVSNAAVSGDKATVAARYLNMDCTYALHLKPPLVSDGQPGMWAQPWNVIQQSCTRQETLLSEPPTKLPAH